MDDLFYNSPTFVPGSKWVPRSHLDALAREIADQEAQEGFKVEYRGSASQNEYAENVGKN